MRFLLDATLMRTGTTRQTLASLVTFISLTLAIPTLPASQAAEANGRKASVVIAASRPFRMGFTGFVYDITPEAVTASRKFVRENGDILAHHIEGVPWTQALNGQAFPKALLEEWEGKKSATPPKGKIYLAISPGRGELKVADKAGPLPAELKGKRYDDPLVMKAYLNYCRRAIEFFKPDYLAIGIEVNEIHNLGPKAWDAYVALHKHVYAELKEGSSGPAHLRLMDVAQHVQAARPDAGAV